MNEFHFTRLELKNWKNFATVDVELANRVFLVGPNATGKSNFLDAIRFLRDVAVEGGGLVQAVELRGKMRSVRSLYARQDTDVMIRATVANQEGKGWRYELGFTHDSLKSQRPKVVGEIVHKLIANGKEECLLQRPDEKDRADAKRLTQTALQQVTANQDFREFAEFLQGINYLHIVPQLLREEQAPRENVIGHDPFGRDLLDRIRNTTGRRGSLQKIERVLKVVAPQLRGLDLKVDDHGQPHLVGKFQHWRPNGAYQNETQLSDGTLRLIGMLWAMQEKGGPLLLEEPELSLHTAIVKRLAPFIHRVQKSDQMRQIILSTHSENLLLDIGIAPEEVLLVKPAREGSEVIQGAKLPDIVRLMQAGITAGEAILPETETEQMAFFDKLSL